MDPIRYGENLCNKLDETSDAARRLAAAIGSGENIVSFRRYAIADESMLREGAAKLEALLQAARDALRVVVVPLRTGKVTAKSPGGDMPFEGVSVTELTEKITRGRD